MSTRCNILIEDGPHKIWLYRHHDGYPADTGANIAKVLKHLNIDRTSRASIFAPVTNALLAQRGPDYGRGDGPSILYEVTTEEHGDIEWRYDITRSPTGVVVIQVREFSWSRYHADYEFDQHRGWKIHSPRTVQAFRKYVAFELAAMRQRIKEFKRKQRA